MKENYDRFGNLNFDDFRRMASDSALTKYERVGFPNSYREGKEKEIFEDIQRKLQNLGKRSQKVLEIGPGCSDLPRMLIEVCRLQGHNLVFIDSQEMLSQLPDEPFVTKIAGRYPEECVEVFEKHASSFDVILTYSVLHYIFADGNLYDFLDRSLGLLADGGEFLIGDIPNLSKRKRFFSSPRGIQFHRQFTGTDEIPTVQFNTPARGAIDDSIVMSILWRCRLSGFDSYLLPQAENLPMSNRREDILVRKP